MVYTVIMPKPGQTMEEAALVKWHKKEGDVVKKGDVLFEIETDKAVLESESFFDGTLLKVLVREGETVPVNVPVAFIGQPGEPLPAVEPRAAKPAAAPAAAAAQPAARPAAASAGPFPAAAPAASAAPAAPPVPSRRFFSPRARALVKASAIHGAAIPGSGPGGRITERDVQAYLLARGYAALLNSPAAKALAIQDGLDILGVRGTGTSGRITVRDIERAMAEKPKPMNKMRQTIARRLTDSFTTTPHFYVSVAVDMTSLLAYRKELKEQGAVWGVTDFILEAVVLSLREFPVLNSVCEGNTVRWRSSVQLGMAVGLEEGLVVPVIRDAQDLSLKALHDLAEALAAKARAGKLLPDEMTGGSFTVSNMGMLGVDNFHAIINPGEAAILAVASTVERPVVREGQIVVRAMMNLTLSVDHRIVDGTTGAALVNAVKKKLEDLELWKSLT